MRNAWKNYKDKSQSLKFLHCSRVPGSLKSSVTLLLDVHYLLDYNSISIKFKD
jgi:hypothetical protein